MRAGSRLMLVLFIWLSLAAFNSSGDERLFAMGASLLVALIFIGLSSEERQ